MVSDSISKMEMSLFKRKNLRRIAFVILFGLLVPGVFPAPVLSMQNIDGVSGRESYENNIMCKPCAGPLRHDASLTFHSASTNSLEMILCEDTHVFDRPKTRRSGLSGISNKRDILFNLILAPGFISPFSDFTYKSILLSEEPRNVETSLDYLKTVILKN
jgi:hypothetical protein